MDITISVDGVKQLQTSFDDMYRNQVPFAFAAAITDTAKDRQAAVQQSQGDGRFILRHASFIKAGVRIEPAKKSNPVGVVKDIDAFMDLQETGGTKLAHGRYLCIPLSGARPTPRSLIDPANLPAAVMASGGFIKQVGGTLVMFRVALKQGRRGRLSKSIVGLNQAATWKQVVRPMYALVPRADVRPRYGFKDTVLRNLGSIFADKFTQRFEQAKRTARL